MTGGRWSRFRHVSTLPGASGLVIRVRCEVHPRFGDLRFLVAVAHDVIRGFERFCLVVITWPWFHLFDSLDVASSPAWCLPALVHLRGTRAATAMTMPSVQAWSAPYYLVLGRMRR